MKKYYLILFICLLTIRVSFGQEFKVDHRTQLEKENPMNRFHPEKTSMLDLLEVIEIQGITINKFEFGKFNKQYNIILLSDQYENGDFIKTDTLSQFESTYHYYKKGKPYFDFIDKIKIITKDKDTEIKLFIKSYSFSSEAKVELKRTSINSFFNWRRYKKTEWELDKKIPLMVFASSWKDEEYGFDRFCGVLYLTDNGKDTNELLALSPSYVVIYYRVEEK